jgi:methylated-DNA-protein-cysteine methyltransferase related protein
MTVFKKLVLEFVVQIPVDKVVSFGQIASNVGGTARVVGFVMSGLTLTECEQVPWWRVVAKNGYISSLKLGYKGQIQKEMLQNAGFEITEDCVNMSKHQWIQSHLDNLSALF